jgi:hypothetical protein
MEIERGDGGLDVQVEGAENNEEEGEQEEDKFEPVSMMIAKLMNCQRVSHHYHPVRQT